jgi:hypothetical protein
MTFDFLSRSLPSSGRRCQEVAPHLEGREFELRFSVSHFGDLTPPNNPAAKEQLAPSLPHLDLLFSSYPKSSHILVTIRAAILPSHVDERTVFALVNKHPHQPSQQKRRAAINDKTGPRERRNHLKEYKALHTGFTTARNPFKSFV